MKPVDPELFARTAPRWNCVNYPNEGMHYTPHGDCVWCGMTREQISAQWEETKRMAACDINAIARAVNERRLESRSVARRKVIELAADIADVLYDGSKGQFSYAEFYKACGFSPEDVRLAQERTIN